MSEVEAYDYTLPPELIAQHPLANRGDARLMVVDRTAQSIEHFHVRDLPEFLRAGDALVLNDTRVVPARLVGHRERTGGKWEGLFLAADDAGHWRLLCRTRGHLQSGEIVVLLNRQAQPVLRLLMLAKLRDGVWAARPEEKTSAWELLERVGRVPLPPYIRKGEMEVADSDSYQTVFAEHPGAVAAPTAGLHFTHDLLRALEKQGVVTTRVTLHVGPGTFRPITAAELAQHPMHREWGTISEASVRQIQNAKRAGKRIVAVGTTSVRVLETAASGGELQPWQGETELFIRPPYNFRAVDALLTNFHLPRSTLLVLVRTFGGNNLLRRAYEEAIAEQYRFYSYGDAMLIV